MATERDLPADLRVLREVYDAAEIDPLEQARLRAGVARAVGALGMRRRFVLPLTLALSGLAAMAVMFFSSEAGWVRIIEGGACLAARSDSDVATAARCGATVDLVPAGARVVLESTTSMTRVTSGVRLVTGRARFAVNKRSAGAAPFVVQVAAGTIVVRGTSFVVEQSSTRGDVHLIEGRIDFQWADSGEVQALGPGETLAWPRPALAPTLPDTLPPNESAEPALPRRARQAKSVAKAHAPEPDPAESAAATLAAEADTNLRPVLRRLLQLRSQQRFADAVTLLRGELERDGLTTAQRERLSYEIGVLLSDELGDDDAACDHWRQHAVAFKSGLRRHTVAERLLDCSGEKK